MGTDWGYDFVQGIPAEGPRERSLENVLHGPRQLSFPVVGSSANVRVFLSHVLERVVRHFPREAGEARRGSALRAGGSSLRDAQQPEARKLGDRRSLQVPALRWARFGVLL